MESHATVAAKIAWCTAAMNRLQRWVCKHGAAIPGKPSNSISARNRSPPVVAAKFSPLTGRVLEMDTARASGLKWRRKPHKEVEIRKRPDPVPDRPPRG